MKRLLLILISILTIKLMFGQLIQNPDFENWQLNDYFEYPQEWMIINEGENTNLLAHKVTGDAQLDNYSIKINTIDDGSDILFGLLVYGDPGDGGNFKGFPFDKTGNMFHFWYKANMQTGDMGMMMLILWKNGARIDSVVYPIMTSQTNWTHAQFPVNTSLIQPDSMFLAILSSIPTDFGGNPVAGTWIQLDNLYFTNGMNPTPLTVPNYSFENWGIASAEDPVSWTTSNGEFELLMNDTANVTKYIDSYSGNYAAMFTNVVYSGKTFSAEMRYNDNFYSQPEKMFLAYKFLPNGLDTAQVGVNFYNNGNHVGGNWLNIYDNQSTYNVTELSFFYMDFPDEIEIFIMSGKNPNTTLIVDDIRFSCSAPLNLYGEFASGSSIQLNWNAGGAETQWQMEWGISGFSPGNGTLELINTNAEFLINGINNTNNYDVYLRSICGVGDTSSWVGPYTVCEAINIPVNESFEGLNNGDIPQCWNKIQSGNTFIGADDMMGMANNGLKYLKMNFSQPNNAFFVTPQIQVPLNTLFISLSAKKNNWVNQAQLLIGTMANPADPGSFVVEKVIDLSNNYINYEHYFDTYLGSDNYIAFKLTTNDFGAEIFIDDIQIDLIPLCATPQDLIVNTITTNSAHVQWSAGTQNLWNIKYGTMGFDPNTSGVSVNGLTNPEYDISSLNPGTTYDVYLQSDCGLDGTSNAIKYTFTTLCVPYNIPLVESFEGVYNDDLPNCWFNNIQGWGMVYVVPWGGNNTQSAANMRINNNMDSAYLITPMLNQNLDELYITFWAYEHTQGNAVLTLGTMSNPTDINTFTPLQNIIINDFYQIFTYYFNNYAGTDQYIALKLKTNSNQYTEIFIDDISIKVIPSCFTPQNINAGNITVNSADITWQQGGNESLWNLIYVQSTLNPFDHGQKITGINTILYNLQGLSSNYTYDVYLQSDCGNGDTSEWSMAYTFTTLCDPYLAPYSENFDNIPQSQIPQCWKNYVMHNDMNAYSGLQNFDPYSQPNHILLFNASTPDPGAMIMMVTPELSNVSGKQIRFQAKASQDNTILDIGYLLNQNLPNSYVNISSINLNSYYSSYTIPLTSLTGNLYIALSHGEAEAGSGLGIYIDDFVF